MTQGAVLHTSFVIDRQFSAAPSRVFAAWADPETKRRWSDCHTDLPDSEYSLDFRLGGTEIHRVVYPSASVQRVEKRFLDIVLDRRIIFSYDIELDSHRLSVSLVTVQFEPKRDGTRMLMTEYIAYLDGHEDIDERIRGTNEGLDRLALVLDPARSSR
jgi:uncharacterized protein YndB with AHSA1/START domain